MTHALLMIALVAAAPTPKPELFEARLAPAPGLLLQGAEGQRGPQIYAGVRNTVAGSILCLLGAGSGVGGIAALVGVPQQTGGWRTAMTAIGWTFAGLGMLFGAIGIPLLIVGIVNLAGPPPLALSVTQQGALAVSF